MIINGFLMVFNIPGIEWSRQAGSRQTARRFFRMMPVQARAGAPWVETDAEDGVTCSLRVEILVVMNMILIKHISTINTNNNIIINNNININTSIITSTSIIIKYYYF